MTMTELLIQVSRLPVQPSPATEPQRQCDRQHRLQAVAVDPRKLPYRCCLVFRNFYVAWLTIVQVNMDGSSTELAAAYSLMQHLHCEDDAQNWQLVKLDQLPVSWNPREFDSLCVYLSQPSPLWETWELCEVKIYVVPQEQETGGDAKAATRLGPVSPPRLDKSVGITGSATEDRLMQLLERRTSRSALAQITSGVEPNAVEEQSARCLGLVLRLRAAAQLELGLGRET